MYSSKQLTAAALISALALGLVCGCGSDRAATSDGTLIHDGAIDITWDAGPEHDAIDDLLPDIYTDIQLETCGAAPPVYDGELCGLAANPCTVLRDEVLLVDGATGYPGRLLDLVLDDQDEPGLLTRSNGGTYAVRTGPNQWTTEKLPVDIFSGYLVRESPSTVLALLTEWDTWTSSLWKRDGSEWSKLEDLPGDLSGVTGLARDQGGCLHAALDVGDQVAYARRDQGWTVLRQTNDWCEAPVLTLAPDGRAQLAFFQASPSSSGWELLVAEPPAAPQAVLELGTNALSEYFIGLATSRTADDPAGSAGTRTHLLFWRATPDDPANFELAYATREPGATWKVTAVLPHLSVGTYCMYEPSYSGEQCSYDYEGYQAQDLIVNAKGEARLLYTRVRRWGSLVGTCDDPYGGGASFGGSADAAPPPPSCTWEGQENVDSWLELGSLSGTTLDSSILLHGGVYQIAGFRAKLDSQGRIHLVTYDHLGKEPNQTDVRYLLVGPQP